MFLQKGKTPTFSLENGIKSKKKTFRINLSELKKNKLVKEKIYQKIKIKN